MGGALAGDARSLLKSQLKMKQICIGSGLGCSASTDFSIKNEANVDWVESCTIPCVERDGKWPFMYIYAGYILCTVYAVYIVSKCTIRVAVTGLHGLRIM